MSLAPHNAAPYHKKSRISGGQEQCDLFARRDLLALVGAGLAFPGSLAAQPLGKTARLIASARKQVGVTTTYDPAYTRLGFPGGDVDRSKGVCTDVVIRAFRDYLGLDLQALVNADMKRAFAAYPKRWGLRTTDRNIDHRRVPNLQTFFTRAGAALPLTSNAADWRPGDIVTSLVGGTLPHIGIVSDRSTLFGRPLVLHNIGRGTREEDALFAHKLTGHYRWGLS